MTWTLGLSAFYHDSAAALTCDGVIVAAAQEERFTRIKHDSSFPSRAIAYCLAEAGIGIEEIDCVGFYEKPLRKFERLLDTYLTVAPRGFNSFRHAIPKWLKTNIHLRREIKRELGKSFGGDILFSEHHESHAASAFFPSPYPEAAILTLDGVGEWATGSYGVGRGNRIELLNETHFPHSLGLLYSAFTYFCGFKINDGEYKLMGLAPYGVPRYEKLVRDELVDVKADGSLFLNMRYFDYCAGVRMTSKHFSRLFGGPPRAPEAPLTQREMDLAASIQAVTEEVVLRSARHVRRETGLERLCMAGGVALNCVANGKLVAERIFEDIWIQPASGDAGGALGVALLVDHHHRGLAREASGEDLQKGSCLGPRLKEVEIDRFLKESGIRYQKFEDEVELCEQVASLLAQGLVVGWVHGRMEFGPRALGARSILADARNPGMQMRVNQLIKFRESFRPFAPIVLKERVAEYFQVDEGFASPYMLITAQLQPEKRRSCAGESSLEGLDRLKATRSVIPAVTHIDYSSRIQTVTQGQNGRFYRLLKEFEKQTSCPVLLNTSFNLKDEPIVCTVRDAWNCFVASGIDALVLEKRVVCKQDILPPDLNS